MLCVCVCVHVCVCACVCEKMVGEYMCSNAFVGENLTDMQA